jgi:hypothetical protein
VVCDVAKHGGVKGGDARSGSVGSADARKRAALRARKAPPEARRVRREKSKGDEFDDEGSTEGTPGETVGGKVFRFMLGLLLHLIDERAAFYL